MVNGPWARFPREPEPGVLAVLLEACSFEVVKREGYGRLVKTRIQLYEEKTRRFPAGLLPRVQAGLPESVSTHVESLKKASLPELIGVSLRPYQVETIEALTKAGRGVAKIPTGCGKGTISAALAAAHPGAKVLVTVPSLRLLRQAREEIAAALGETVGIFGEGQVDLGRRVVVATVQSLGASLKVKKGKKKAKPTKNQVELRERMPEFDVWVCDEAHGAAADTYELIGEALVNCWHRYGLTATWIREDGMELKMEGVLGPVVYEFSYRDAFEQGYLTRPSVLWQQLPSQVMWYRDDYHSAYNEQFIYNRSRHLKIALDVGELIEAGAKSILVLVDRLEHGRRLAEVLEAPFVNGESEQDLLEERLLDLEAGKLQVLVASGILNVGVNLPTLAAVVNACGGKSKVEAAQKAGRGLRKPPGKTSFVYLEYEEDEPKIFSKHAGVRRLWFSRLFGPKSSESLAQGKLGRHLETLHDPA